VDDPNQGKTEFVYNGFGELEKELDANSDVIRYDMVIVQDTPKFHNESCPVLLVIRTIHFYRINFHEADWLMVVKDFYHYFIYAAESLMNMKAWAGINRRKWCCTHMSLQLYAE